MKKQMRFVHVRKVTDNQELMLRLKVSEAEKLVADNQDWQYVNRSVYRAWLDKQPKPENKRIESRPLKLEINDQLYRESPNHTTYVFDDDKQKVVEVRETLSKDELAELGKHAFIRSLTTTPIDKLNRERTKYDRSKRHNKSPRQHQLVVVKEDIERYLEYIKRDFKDKKPKSIILYDDIKYRTIITHPYTPTQQQSCNVGIDKSEFKSITFTKEFCDMIGVTGEDVKISVKITIDKQPQRKAKKTSTKVKSWRHPITPKR